MFRNKRRNRCFPKKAEVFLELMTRLELVNLSLTKGVLCLLSYISKMATRNGLEPSTSSVTG